MSNIYGTHKPQTGGGEFLKIEDGQSVVVQIASEPAIFEVESKPDDNGKTRITTRYGWIVWNHELKMPQIWQGSATFFRSLAALATDDNWGDPQGYPIKIKREGLALETTYLITPSPKKAMLGVVEMDAVKAVDLITALSASPFSQHVMWLSAFDNPGSAKIETPAANNGFNEANRTPAPQTPDDGFGQPINLDDIPF